MITVRKIDQSYLRVTGDDEDLYILREYFAKFKDKYWFDKKYTEGDWDGNIRHYNMYHHTLPYGLIGELFKCVEDHNIDCEVEGKLLDEIDDKPLTDFEKYAFMNVNPAFLEGGDCEARDYQIEGARAILEARRGILEHATRSGKSLTSFLAVNYIFNKHKQKILDKGIKVVVIVPTTTLILQFTEDFVDYGMDEKFVGRYYKDEKTDDRPVIVGTWHSLRSAGHIHKKTAFIIGDEVHGAKAYEIKQLLEKCTNARIRLGMTGTLPSDPNERYTIMGSFGPILSTLKAKELIDRGILAKANINVLLLKYPRGTDADVKRRSDSLKNVKNKEGRFEYALGKLREKLKPYYKSEERLDANIERHTNIKNQTINALIFEEADKNMTEKAVDKIRKTSRKINDKRLRYDIEKECISNNVKRKKLSRNIIKKHGNETMLFLFDEEKFGIQYYEYLKKCYPDKTIRFVNYRVDVKDRDRIKKEAVEEEGVIIVASLYTFATGITIPKLSVICLLWGGQSETTIPQAIGRGLTICGALDEVEFYDFNDQLHYSKEHGNNRIKIYMKEGHHVRIAEINI